MVRKPSWRKILRRKASLRSKILRLRMWTQSQDQSRSQNTHPYDPETGDESIGVEFAGSAVSSPCPYGQNLTLANANNYSSLLTAANQELQWQDLYYRGYYEISVSKEAVYASFFGMPTIATRNGYEISLANFTVLSGANKFMRSGNAVAGGVTESGSLKYGITSGTNITNDTATGLYFISSYNLDTA
ncbi:uncharacterized protein LY89DRAFT_781403 [Mollisia scopiformis]|uniref:PhoD-like phosphatase metallophosphatase domain-containing protein n=1 Tax=Mollisia scopiformis TaxID=149040 RepID=A0A194XDS4_MOLSC|nr:uncharacterized protein LY89DRAFT_781403 [Mollisia scopiformis]KUJ18335.1 hypothetical protein LY89DRAFT_781403 [Mollisia scopiformis]